MINMGERGWEDGGRKKMGRKEWEREGRIPIPTKLSQKTIIILKKKFKWRSRT